MIKCVASKRQEITNADMNVEEKEHLYTVGSIVDWCRHCEKCMKNPLKIKDRTSIWSSNYIYGNICKGNKNTNSKGFPTFPLHSHIICKSQGGRQPKCPLMDEWTKDLGHTHIHSGVLLGGR